MKRLIGCLFVLCVLLAASPAFSANLLQDPGFENGGTAWAAYGALGTVVSPGRSGNNCMYYAAQTGMTMGAGALQWTIPGLDRTMGFRFRAWVKVPSASPTNPSAFEFRYGFAGSRINIGRTPIETSDWVEVVGPWLKAPAGETTLDLVGFRVLPPDSSATFDTPEFFLDDLQVETGPAYSVTGKVIDSITNAGIANAAVTVSAGGAVIDSTTTDASGRYTAYVPFSDTPTDYSISAYHGLYAEGIPVIASCPPSPATAPDIVLDKYPTSLIHGKIVDHANGQGIPGVKVGVSMTSGAGFAPDSSITTTDAKGNYSVEVVQYQEYYLIAHKPGYMIYGSQREWYISYDAVDPEINIEMLVDNRGLLLALDPKGYTGGKWVIGDGKLTFDYFLANGAPAFTPSVSISGHSALKTGDGTSCTGFAGPLCPDSLGGANPRTLEAWVYCPTSGNHTIFQLSRQYTEDVDGTNLPNGNFAFANAGADAIFCRPDGGATWGGTATDRFGKWVYLALSYDGATATMYVNGVQTNTKAFVYSTEAGGSMAIGNMRGFHNGTKATTPYSFHEWDVWARYNGYLGAIRVYEKARTAAEIASDYALGINYGEVAMAMPAIYGRVTNMANAPLAGVAISATDGTNPALNAITNAQGEYRITVLPNTSYTVTAGLFGYQTGSEFVGVGTSDYLLNFKLAELPAITGKVTTPELVPLENIKITATAGTNTYTGYTNAQGTYEVPVPANTAYTVTASRMGYSTPAAKNVTVAATDVVADFTMTRDPRGLVLAMRPKDYDPASLKWTISDGYMKDDYFLSNGAAAYVPTVGPTGFSGVLQNYSGNAGRGFAGPVCPDILGGASPRTLEAWVFNPSGTGGAIFDLSRQYTEDAGGTNLPQGNFGFANGTNEALYSLPSGSANWAGTQADRFGKWVYLTISYDGATARFYVNGVQTATKDFVYNTEAGGSMTIGTMRGFHNGAKVTTPYSFDQWDAWPIFRGFLGAIRVYDRARAAADIAADYALGVNYGETHIDPPTITGKVTTADGVTPFVGAKVTATGGALPYSAVTDAQGQYSLIVEPNVSFTVNAYKLGYDCDPVSRTVVGPATGVDFKLTAAAPKLLIDLKADSLTPGTLTSWPNNATALGGVFQSTEATAPVVATVAPHQAVTFSGSQRLLLKDAANVTIAAPSAITGTNGVYTVAAWLFNPVIASEEYYLDWARRGGPDGTCASFGYGSNTGYGAAGHWGGPDIGFGPLVPPAGVWHHIAVTFDGATEYVYVDGVMTNSEAKTMSFYTGQPISVGAAYGNADGTGLALGFSGSIGSLEVWDQPLTATAIQAKYQTERAPYEITVSGKVTLKGTNAPVANATVAMRTAALAADLPAWTVKTNAAGEYSIVVKANTTAYLAAYKGGYLPMPTPDVQLNVLADDITGVNFQLDSYVGATKLIDLNAAQLPLGELASWTNAGTITGTFNSDQATKPLVEDVNGYKAVTFSGSNRLLSSFTTPYAITGNGDFTVSAWLYNPGIGSNEGYLAWARRADVGGHQMTYGTSTVYGASRVGAYGMGFGTSVPSANAWHHVAVTYDGAVQKVYVDGALANQKAMTLATLRTDPISVGSAYTAAAGATLNSQYSGSIASLQVYDVAQDAATIASYAANKPQATSAVKGVVTDGSKPVYNAVVQVGGFGGPAAVTDANGAYMILKPPVGSVEIYADALGFEATTSTITTTADMGEKVVNIVLKPKAETGVIKNGGFEVAALDGTPADWNISVGFSFSRITTENTTPLGGAAALVQPTATTPREWTGMYQDIEIVPGSVYNFYFKAKGAGSDAHFTKLDILDTNKASIGGQGWVDINGWLHAPTANWTQFLYGLKDTGEKIPMVRLPMPANARYMRCFFSYNAGAALDPANDKQIIDDVVIDRVPGTAPAEDVANIAALKAKGVGAVVRLTGSATVTYAPRNTSNARSTTYFYIGEKQGLGGLRVVALASDSLNVGDIVTGLTGTVKKTAAGEFYLELTADATGTAGAAIPALGLNNKSALTDPMAQTNAVRVWGKVQQVGSGYFTISDGFNSAVKVMVNGVALPAGFDGTKTAVVTGVVSKDDAGNPVVLLQAIRAL